jgi:hypothetical protein
MQSSYLYLLSARIIGMCHHTQLIWSSWLMVHWMFPNVYWFSIALLHQLLIGDLNFPIIIIDLSISPFSFYQFCFIYFSALLFGALILLHYIINHSFFALINVCITYIFISNYFQHAYFVIFEVTFYRKHTSLGSSF